MPLSCSLLPRCCERSGIPIRQWLRNPLYPSPQTPSRPLTPRLAAGLVCHIRLFLAFALIQWKYDGDPFSSHGEALATMLRRVENLTLVGPSKFQDNSGEANIGVAAKRMNDFRVYRVSFYARL